MSNFSVPGYEDGRDLFKRFFAQYDVPAYARRARAVEDAWERVLHTCRQKREKDLLGVRLRVARLASRLESWSSLEGMVEDVGDVERIHHLADAPEIAWQASWVSQRAVRTTVRDLAECVSRFNAGWSRFVYGFDLAAVNRLRDGYNRWYLLEKECALRSARLAARGYRSLPAATAEEILDHFPLLPVPRLRK